ncbi:hypothetical protein EYF80_012829 [Liparis tanakae]|uniref:Uncharacterized protein n=1 Tax=Liparis tanakae TaxID=230148 RepID=A0A4Z2IIF8_9TELE|nr:hypothetical protein EYF80_012829 [Liparis tanakae]
MTLAELLLPRHVLKTGQNNCKDSDSESVSGGSKPSFRSSSRDRLTDGLDERRDALERGSRVLGQSPPKAHEEGNQPSQAGPSDSKPSSNYCLICSPNEINAWRAGRPGRLAKALTFEMRPFPASLASSSPGSYNGLSVNCLLKDGGSSAQPDCRLPREYSCLFRVEDTAGSCQELRVVSAPLLGHALLCSLRLLLTD